MPRFACPTCSAVLQHPVVGDSVLCPRCRHALTVPGVLPVAEPAPGGGRRVHLIHDIGPEQRKLIYRMTLWPIVVVAVILFAAVIAFCGLVALQDRSIPGGQMDNLGQEPIDVGGDGGGP